MTPTLPASTGRPGPIAPRAALKPASIHGLLVLLGLVVCASCSSERDRVATYPVRGKVLFDGQPAEGAIVVLHRASPTDPPTTNPNGRVLADGSFQLTTYESDDGAPAGEYIVTVFWPEPPDSPVDHPDMGPDRLSNRYTNPEDSEIHVTVTEDDNLLEPIHLK